MQQQSGKLFCNTFFTFITLPPVGQVGNLGQALLLSGPGGFQLILSLLLPAEYFPQAGFRFFHRTGYLIEAHIQFAGLLQLLLQGFEVCFGALFILNTLLILFTGGTQ